VLEIKSALNQYGLTIIQDGDMLQLVTDPEITAKLHLPKQVSENLSSAALEVLSIIAYKQPITQDEIEQIRGVGSYQSLRGLLEKDLIEKRELKQAGIVHTRYTTTLRFLRQVGIHSLSELPQKEVIKNE